MKNKNLPTIYSEGNISPVSTAPTAEEDDQHVSASTTTTETSNGASNNNNDDEEDQRAALEAARHRQDAQNLVREHLENHVAHNPGASSDYVTWIATLHPENADVTIDYRFFVPGNPWWTIYEDTKNNQIPIATAVPVSNLSDTVREEEDLEQGEKADPEQPLPKQDVVTKTTTSHSKEEPPPHCCLTCNPIAYVTGLAILAPAAFAVLAIELVAFVFLYVPSTLLYHAGQAFAPPNICTCLLYFVFMSLYCAMALADSIVLVASVLCTECIGVVGLLVGFLTGGCLWAKHLQQSIRKTCHGIRIAFRRDGDARSTTLPSRSLCCCRRTTASLERERKANRERGVRVVNVQRVRRPGESCH